MCHRQFMFVGTDGCAVLTGRCSQAGRASGSMSEKESKEYVRGKLGF